MPGSLQLLFILVENIEVSQQWESVKSVCAYVWERDAARPVKILHIYLWADIWSTAPLKCQNMFVNGESEWQSFTHSNFKLTIFF